MTDPKLIERAEKALEKWQTDAGDEGPGLALVVPELLAALRSQGELLKETEAEAIAMKRSSDAWRDTADQAYSERDRLAAEVSELRGENEKLWAVADCFRPFGDTYILSAHGTELDKGLSALPTRDTEETS